MFDNMEGLEMMAKAAKETLARQNENVPMDEEEELAPTPSNVIEDIYAEMRQEFGEDANSNMPIQQEEDEHITIQQNPSEDYGRPVIANEPDEDYYEERPQINPYDKPIFPGGPLQSQISSWKKQYDGYDVYVSEILGQYFVFRTLNRFEYKQIVALQNTDPLIREEIICETVTLWPNGYDYRTMATDKAGLPSTLAQIVMEKSGFTREYGIQVL